MPPFCTTRCELLVSVKTAALSTVIIRPNPNTKAPYFNTDPLLIFASSIPVADIGASDYFWGSPALEG